ncbi:MAG TPA: Minf_1886 family protein [Verrucomicrobiae bacterium]
MQQRSFEEGVEQIVAKDNRYDAEAYEFLRDALDFTQKSLGRAEKTMRQREGVSGDAGNHVSGQQLLNGIRDFALQRYGPMTMMIFESWGVKRTDDFGEIVFNMVSENLLGKTENDSREDFKNVYDFDVTFRQPYLPKAKQTSIT